MDYHHLTNNTIEKKTLDNVVNYYVKIFLVLSRQIWHNIIMKKKILGF